MKQPKLIVPKIGQLAWIYHVKSGKSRPYLIVNKFWAGKDQLKIICVYATTCIVNNMYVGNDTYVDVRRIEEFDVAAVNSVDSMVEKPLFINVVQNLKKQIKTVRYGS
jgi:hypothetical protein